jgi:hypothetical protein
MRFFVFGFGSHTNQCPPHDSAHIPDLDRNSILQPYTQAARSLRIRVAATLDRV